MYILIITKLENIKKKNFFYTKDIFTFFLKKKFLFNFIVIFNTKFTNL